MRPILLSIAAAITLLFAGRTFPEEQKTIQPAPQLKDAPMPAATDKPKPTAEELEAKFKATLTKATMSGRWCSIKDGALGPEKEDKYTIVSVAKLSGDAWVINARIQYNKLDFIAPIPVQVKWAGDTPVLIVDKFPTPGGRVYSARVLIYDQTYAGTWTGGDYGGLLNGIITNEKEPKSSETK